LSLATNSRKKKPKEGCNI
jgi:hypothetical protein